MPGRAEAVERLAAFTRELSASPPRAPGRASPSREGSRPGSPREGPGRPRVCRVGYFPYEALHGPVAPALATVRLPGSRPRSGWVPAPRRAYPRAQRAPEPPGGPGVTVMDMGALTLSRALRMRDLDVVGRLPATPAPGLCYKIAQGSAVRKQGGGRASPRLHASAADPADGPGPGAILVASYPAESLRPEQTRAPVASQAAPPASAPAAGRRGGAAPGGPGAGPGTPTVAPGGFRAPGVPPTPTPGPASETPLDAPLDSALEVQLDSQPETAPGADPRPWSAGTGTFLTETAAPLLPGALPPRARPQSGPEGQASLFPGKDYQELMAMAGEITHASGLEGALRRTRSARPARGEGGTDWPGDQAQRRLGSAYAAFRDRRSQAPPEGPPVFKVTAPPETLQEVADSLTDTKLHGPSFSYGHEGSRGFLQERGPRGPAATPGRTPGRSQRPSMRSAVNYFRGENADPACLPGPAPPEAAMNLVFAKPGLSSGRQAGGAPLRGEPCAAPHASPAVGGPARAAPGQLLYRRGGRSGGWTLRSADSVPILEPYVERSLAHDPPPLCHCLLALLPGEGLRGSGGGVHGESRARAGAGTPQTAGTYTPGHFPAGPGVEPVRGPREGPWEGPRDGPREGTGAEAEAGTSEEPEEGFRSLTRTPGRPPAEALSKTLSTATAEAPFALRAGGSPEAEEGPAKRRGDSPSRPSVAGDSASADAGPATLHASMLQSAPPDPAPPQPAPPFVRQPFDRGEKLSPAPPVSRDPLRPGPGRGARRPERGAARSPASRPARRPREGVEAPLPGKDACLARANAAACQLLQDYISGDPFQRRRALEGAVRVARRYYLAACLRRGPAAFPSAQDDFHLRVLARVVAGGAIRLSADRVASDCPAAMPAQLAAMPIYVPALLELPWRAWGGARAAVPSRALMGTPTLGPPAFPGMAGLPGEEANPGASAASAAPTTSTGPRGPAPAASAPHTLLGTVAVLCYLLGTRQSLFPAEPWAPRRESGAHALLVAHLACAHSRFLSEALVATRIAETGVLGQALRTRDSPFERVVDGTTYELLQALSRAFLSWRARLRPAGFFGADAVGRPDPMYAGAQLAINDEGAAEMRARGRDRGLEQISGWNRQGGAGSAQGAQAGQGAQGALGPQGTPPARTETPGVSATEPPAPTLGQILREDLPRALLLQGPSERIRDSEFLCDLRLEFDPGLLEAAGLLLAHTPGELLLAQLPRLRLLSLAAAALARGLLFSRVDPRALGGALQGVPLEDPRPFCGALYLLKGCASALLELDPEGPVTEYLCGECFSLAALAVGDLCLPFVRADAQRSPELFSALPLDLAGLPPPFACFPRAPAPPGANARDAARAGEGLDRLAGRHYVSAFVMRLWLSRAAAGPGWWAAGPEPAALRALENYRPLEGSSPLVEQFSLSLRARGGGPAGPRA